MKKTVSFSKYLDFGTFCVTLPLYTTTFFSWFHYHAKNSAIMHFSPLWAFSTFGTAELAGAVTLRKVCYVFLGGVLFFSWLMTAFLMPSLAFKGPMNSYLTLD